MDLVERRGVDPAAVREIRVALSPPKHKLHSGFARYPATFEAMLAAHDVIAAIVHDRTRGLAQF